MHGRRRLPPGAEKHMDEENKKAEKAFAIVKAAISARSQGPCPAPILTAASAVLTRNPEVYSLWNMRREAVAEALEGEEGRSTAQAELQLVGKCLEKNHKSYSAWHHRQWVVHHGHIELDNELASVEKHLNVVTGDTKNFHAWKYRSWLVERAGKSPHSEEDFTRSLLEAEPNNFSALHHRIVALAAAHMSASSTSEALAVTPAFGVTCQGRPESTDTPMAIRDWQRQGTDATMAVDAPETAAEAQRTTQSAYTEEAAAIHVAKMQYSGARVLPISLEVIGKELKALYEIVGIDPANSAQWGYHLWLLRCAAAHTRGPDQGSCTTRVQKILEDSKLQCEQIVAGESARMATLRGRNVQNSLSVEAGSCGAGGESESSQGRKVGATVMALAGLAHQCSLLALTDVLQLLQKTFKQDSGEDSAALAEAYRKLQEVDPLRRGYYADQLAALASN